MTLYIFFSVFYQTLNHETFGCLPDNGKTIGMKGNDKKLNSMNHSKVKSLHKVKTSIDSDKKFYEDDEGEIIIKTKDMTDKEYFYFLENVFRQY